HKTGAWRLERVRRFPHEKSHAREETRGHCQRYYQREAHEKAFARSHRHVGFEGRVHREGVHRGETSRTHQVEFKWPVLPSHRQNMSRSLSVAWRLRSMTQTMSNISNTMTKATSVYMALRYCKQKFLKCFSNKTCVSTCTLRPRRNHVVGDTDGSCRMSHKCHAPRISSERFNILPHPYKGKVLIKKSNVPSGLLVFQA
ncbi:unnamed protein product, partial [Nesidiocoris tenuis]